MDTPPPSKRPKFNPLGQDCHLGSDGSVTRDEDKIIAAQRIWKEAAYAPGGIMYLKTFAHWNSRLIDKINIESH